MFILTTFSDLVQIPPHEFYKRSRDEVEDKINEKYSNKVVQKVGLCMCMYDLLKASDGLIGHGTGNVNVNVKCIWNLFDSTNADRRSVEFRLIVFRPFKGEIILGKIASSNREGIRISTEFFDDILVPANMLFPETSFDENEKLWLWNNDSPGEYYFEDGDPVRFRVEAELWQDQAPTGPRKDLLEDGKQPKKVPYSITASMAEGGLGPVDWW